MAKRGGNGWLKPKGLHARRRPTRLGGETFLMGRKVISHAIPGGGDTRASFPKVLGASPLIRGKATLCELIVQYVLP